MFLSGAIQTLKNASVPTPALDAEVLAADILNVDRSWLHAHSEDELTTKQAKLLLNRVKRRAKHEPIAYIIGRKEFYGREFIVNPDVLVPRPESESIIELLRILSHHSPHKVNKVLDIGTGSGCIAISSKLEFPSLDVYATDISNKALQTAKINAKNLNANIKFKRQVLLVEDNNDYDIILANLPYVPEFMQNKSIMHEPREALYGGTDGMNHYRKLFKQLERKKVRYIMTESLISQHREIEKLAKLSNYNLSKTDGLVQLFTKVEA